ncbi:endonuclease-reverse transcriptase [Plakobranchus ocellatus]|uniref:Endonuclease-reverse transcriptase n=1 Tax=Plakobranchus ocellatus TaxID=259542 RepID=A0AAV4BI76_9GAST|nr:endonuclease-reverse transcriptase [Plakobranchus ocellatus]
MSEEASKLLGKPRVNKKKYMTDEILALCDQSRSLKKRKKESECGKQYRDTNLKVKRSIKEATEKWIEDQCEDIENSLEHNNITTECGQNYGPSDWSSPYPKKRDLKLCQNYRTISLISHPSKVMLKVILNRLKPEAEKIIAEEQAGFRPGRSTVEQICNVRILMEKYLQHQQELHHVFIDFKKPFDRV